MNKWNLKVRWTKTPHERDLRTGLVRAWSVFTKAGRYDIYVGRPYDLAQKTFVYELRRPDGTCERFTTIRAAKEAVTP